MVYYVFLDPRVVQHAAANGEAGLSCLASLLMALAENCCVAEFDDWRTHPELRRQIETQVPANSDWSKRLKTLLVRLERQNRFIGTLRAPEAHPPISDLESVRQQAAAASIDAIVTFPPMNEAGSGLVELDVLSFAASEFDLERREHARGVVLSGGEHTSKDFCRLYLEKALRHAGKIEFIDRMFGDKYGDHFKYTFRSLVRHYAEHCESPVDFCVHTGNSNRIAHCRTETASFDRSVTVCIEAYELDGSGATLPHERFLLTDQFAFEIGRGLDLFDQETDRNRDVSISFKTPRQVEGLLTRAAASKIPYPGS